MTAQFPRPRKLRIVAMPAYRWQKTNPYNALLYRAMETAGGAQISLQEYRPGAGLGRRHILHLHWPDLSWDRPGFFASLLRGGALLSECLGRKIFGGRIVWTAHNLHSHEDRHPCLRQLFWPCLEKLLDGVILLSESTRHAVLAAHPGLAGKPMVMIPHGHYGPTLLPRRSRDEARAAFDLSANAKVMVCFGAIRSYKAIPELIANFARVPDAAARLIVAGSPADRVEMQKIETLAQADRRVIIIPRHMEQEELQRLVESADVIALPYRAVLNSGSVMYALSLGRRVLVMQQPTFDELRHQVGAGWIHYFSPVPAPADLDAALNAGAERDADGPNLSSYEWAPIAHAHQQFFCSVVEGTASAN